MPMRRRPVNALRLAWLVVAALSVALSVMGQSALYREFRTLATRDPGMRDIIRANLSHLGLSVDVYAAYLLALPIVIALVCLAVALIIVVRRSDQPMALFVALLLVLLGTTFSGSMRTLGDRSPLLAWLSGMLSALSLESVILLLYLFPDGRFEPRWTRWPALLSFALVVLTAMVPVPGSPLTPDNWPLELDALFVATMLLTGIAAQIYRYRRISGDAARQQTKLVVLSVALALLGDALVPLLPDLSSSFQPGTLWDLVGAAVMTAGMLCIPVSFGVAILRYHLWDVNLIIRRTLVYAPLTGILAGLFAALPAMFQWVFVRWTGGQSRGALVLSTIVVVAVFFPVRDRLQLLVNRHFRVAAQPAQELAVLATAQQGAVPATTVAGTEWAETQSVYIAELRDELAGLRAQLASRTAEEQELRDLVTRLEERILSQTNPPRADMPGGPRPPMRSEEPPPRVPPAVRPRRRGRHHA